MKSVCFEELPTVFSGILQTLTFDFIPHPTDDIFNVIIREQIRDYITELASEHGYEGEVKDDAPLVTSGILDSFAVMRLVVFMEKAFGISFADEFFDQSIFDTVDGMVEFVYERTSGREENT